MPVSRALLIFSKTDKARFIGHLDLMRVFRRAVNRAGLPVAYSEGFNPHQKLSFAAPLALGAEGYNEAAELELDAADETTAADIARKLNAALPKGLFVHAARWMGADEKSPAALVTASYYEISIVNAAVLPENISELLARGSIAVQKRTKNGVKDTDIRPDIISLDISGGTLHAVLSSGGQRGLKPELLFSAMNAPCGRYARINVFKTVNGALLPLYNS